MEAILALALCIGAAIGGGELARRKGRRNKLWAVLCLFWPILIIVLYLMPDAKEQRPRAKVIDQQSLAFRKQ
jgi:MFS family permease